MKKVAILQSNYIPWKGYFDIINMVDEFVLYDDVQYTKRDWRNRNLIKSQQGTQWLTIPIEVKGKYFQTIKDSKISEKDWNQKHWKIIVQNYSKAKYFNEFKSFFEELYIKAEYKYLSEINYFFITSINKLLNISTIISWSSDYILSEGKNEKLIDIINQTNSKEYISGPSAKNYIDEKMFAENNINIEWVNYNDYPEYEQLFPPFDHYVSIIDLIFNVGYGFKKYMKTFN